MPVQPRALAIGLVLAACLIVGASGKAYALFDHIPPFKGNDTGGIIAWSLAQKTDAKKLAADHCAGYGKLVKRLATQPYYGGYISFACVWPRGERVIQVKTEHVLRVRN